MRTETHWLTPEQQQVWRTYLLASSLLTVRLSADLRPYGLDLSEYEVLVALSEAPERALRMSELADTVHQSRSRLTHTVTRMQANGWLDRESSTQDRRGVLARLTDVGFDVLHAAAPHHVAAVRQHLVDVVDPADFDALGRAMTAVLKALPEG